MGDTLTKVAAYFVALRKESVDRNRRTPGAIFTLLRSLSARRAWIEMASLCYLPGCVFVALRKESVDRNMLCLLFRLVAGCRSPQGERG